jgi:UDP-N-acetylmuramoyl-tripeptide--D-alanyl-D-alanine ligase
VVGDSLQTLQALSKYHRRYLNLPIFITGSVEKKLPLKLIYTVLSKSTIQETTIGNLNHIGVPLTLCLLMNNQFGIVEMSKSPKRD